MKRAAIQLIAVIVYEMRLQWRRRGLLVLLAGYLAVLLLSNLWISDVTAEVNKTMPAVDPPLHEQIEYQQATMAILTGTWPVSMILLTISLPLVVSETIPKDRQDGVRDLLDSIPWPRSVYLTGKLMSVWVYLLGGLAFNAVVAGLAAWFLQGPYEIYVYAQFWVLGILPLALFASAIGTLLPAGQKTRRQAAFLGSAASGYCFLTLFIILPGKLWEQAGWMLHFLQLQAQFMNSLGGGDLGLVPYNPKIILLTLVGAGAQVLFAWFLAWGWLQWQELRAS